MGQNDSRSNQIIGKLVSLRDGLDSIFQEIEDQMESLEHENQELKKQLRSGGRDRVVETFVENPNVTKRYEQQIEALRNEIESIRQR